MVDRLPYVLGEGNAAIYYETSGSGIPIIMIHPPAMGHVTFMKQKPLAEHFQLIVFDLRGNGRSSSGTKKITIELLAKDVKAVLDDLNIDRAVIFGYSNGGTTALEFALSYPERTLALVLSGSFPLVNTLLLKNEFRLGIGAAHYQAMDLLANVLAKAHFKKYEAKERKTMTDYIKRSNPHIVRDMYMAGLSYNCADRLHEINVPVLLIYGGNSFYLHPYCLLFADQIAQLDVVFIEDATHQLPTKYYRELNHILISFIKKNVEFT